MQNEYNFIHITGWTRGGTTLCKRSFITFKDIWVAPHEPQPDYVVPKEVTGKNIIVKNPKGGHWIQGWLNRGAKVVYIIRDPRDKIASDWDPKDTNLYKGERMLMPSGQQLLSVHQQGLYDYIRDFDEFVKLNG